MPKCKHKWWTVCVDFERGASHQKCRLCGAERIMTREKKRQQEQAVSTNKEEEENAGNI